MTAPAVHLATSQPRFTGSPERAGRWNATGDSHGLDALDGPGPAHDSGGRSLVFDPVCAGIHRVELSCRGRPGANIEKRSLALVIHEGTEDNAIATFYREALGEVAAGPAWLHDIALVDYDFMSDEGNGWFRDIEALNAAIPRALRHHVFLCLHGWYDWVGRYCFDSATHKLDDSWKTFGRYDEVKENKGTMNLDGTRVDTGFAQCKPVAMTKRSLHEPHLTRRAQRGIPRGPLLRRRPDRRHKTAAATTYPCAS